MTEELSMYDFADFLSKQSPDKKEENLVDLMILVAELLKKENIKIMIHPKSDGSYEPRLEHMETP